MANRIRGIFITGTGTDVGKTVITGALLRAFHDSGIEACALKPLQTGLNTNQSDASIYSLFSPDSLTDTLLEFPLAASPALAANQAGQVLEVAQIAAGIQEYYENSRKDFLLLEGAGGIHVPINESVDMLDLMKCLGLPCLLVCDNALGAVNRTILSLNALIGAGLAISGVILNDSTPPTSKEQELVMADNASTIARAVSSLPGKPLFGRIPHISKWDEQSRNVVACLLQPFARALTDWKPETRSLIARDRACLWHPYESPQKPSPLEEAETTAANYIFLKDGRKLIDGMSSWWAAIHGYRHPQLMQALTSQAARMPHIMFGGFTHEPAVALAERLLMVLPGHLSRIFFCDSGSVAVEVALKLALQYQVAIGEVKRNKFVTIAGGYHGDTFGAMSVCDPDTGMHGLFADFMAQQIFLPRPKSRFGSAYDFRESEQAEKMLAERGEEIAALILEPIVQGAGGMWFYHPQYLDDLEQICRKHGILLIHDEIATGFGRTGKYFATSWTGTHPDILCIGKALTGGVLSLAATICTEQIVEALGEMALMHGPTFMANPLACAVAAASLDVLAENHWVGQVGVLEKELLAGLAPCRAWSGVADVRVLGAIGVVEMKEPVNTSRLNRFFVGRNVWIRPFEKLIYLMPPYITPFDDVARLCAAVRDAVYQGEWRKADDS